jgi:hypothetical protein
MIDLDFHGKFCSIERSVALRETSTLRQRSETGCHE